jgi:hypothetical protein
MAHEWGAGSLTARARLTLGLVALLIATTASASTGSTGTISGERLGLSLSPFFADGVGYGTSGEEAEEDSTVATPPPPPAIKPEAAQANGASGIGRTKMVLLSALVPGLGQLENGDKTWGAVFLMGEVASWSSLIAFETQGSQREDRMVEYAERFAGVEDAGGQSDSYYSSLATYDRSGLPGGPDSYNEIEVRDEARSLYPDDLDQQAAYITQHEITGPLAWDWESDDRRFEFADLRIASETSYHRANYAIAGLVAGRVLSVLHAVWSTADHGGETDSDGAELRHGASFAPLVESDLVHGASRLGLRYRF